jgi:hypothetical protein
MQTVDLTTCNEVLKELYDGQKVQNMTYKDNPALALIPKAQAGGKYYPVPIQYANGQGRSAAFTNAQANQSANKFKEFLVTEASDYALGTIDNRTMMSAKTDKQAFINVAEREINSKIRILKNSIGSALFRSGTGSIGQITSISSGVITLSNRLDVVQFAVGMTLNANATDGGTPRAALGYIIAVNKAAGTITVSATSISGSAGSPSGWTANDYLLADGDNNAKIKGFSAWLPWTAPTSGDSFFNVDRSVDVVSLAGNRYDGSSQTIEEGLQDGLSEVSLYGDGSTDIVVMNPNSYTNLIKSLGSKVQYVDLMSDAGIGFKGVMIEGPRGQVKVLQDRNCPALMAYALQLDTWEIRAVGDVPMFLTYGKEGLEMLRVSNADAAEFRLGYYAQLVCNAPGYNGVIKLSA